MPAENLHACLKKAFTEANLNKITTRVIEAYRQKNFAYIRALDKKINSGSYPDDDRIHKVFAGIILKYHPDRLNHYLAALENTSDVKQLDQFKHIFTALENLDQTVGEEIPPEPEVTFVPEEEYGLDESDFEYLIEEDENFEPDIYEESAFSRARDFITMLTINEYGHNRFEIPRRELEGLTGMLDMSNQGIEDLNGIEFCKNITGLDLSDNELVNITDLGHLISLQELYLSGNSIISIDSIMLLDRLKKLDLSFNSLDDIAPLVRLSSLEFVNLIGNPVPAEQIAKLRSQGVVVII